MIKVMIEEAPYIIFCTNMEFNFGSVICSEFHTGMSITISVRDIKQITDQWV